MTLLEYIKGKAEEKYPYINLPHTEIIRHSYTSGCKDTLELMMGFYKILSDNFEEYPNDMWQCLTDEYCDKWDLQYETFYTIHDLLCEHLESLNK